MSTARKSLWITGIALVLLFAVNDSLAQRSRGGGGGGGFGGGGSGGARQQVNPALQEVNTAKAALDQANAALATAKVKAEAVFHKSDEYQAKQKAVDDADTAKDKARKALIAKLKTQPDYKAALDKESAADAKLKQLRADGAPRADITDASLQVLKAGTVTSGLENEALKTDTAFTSATANLTAAIASRKELEDSFGEKLKEDPTIQPLMAKVDEAKTTYAAAQAKYQGDRSGVTPSAANTPSATAPASKPASKPATQPSASN